MNVTPVAIGVFILNVSSIFIWVFYAIIYFLCIVFYFPFGGLAAML